MMPARTPLSKASLPNVALMECTSVSESVSGNAPDSICDASSCALSWVKLPVICPSPVAMTELTVGLEMSLSST